jgi:hypothetical protein
MAEWDHEQPRSIPTWFKIDRGEPAPGDHETGNQLATLSATMLHCVEKSCHGANQVPPSNLSHTQRKQPSTRSSVVKFRTS